MNQKNTNQSAVKQKPIMEQIKEKNCPCVKSTGNYAVFVDQNCPKSKLIKGVFVVGEFDCLKCPGPEWKEKRRGDWSYE